MSDVSQGDGWWLASDGKWYAPEVAAPTTPPPSPITTPTGGPAMLPASVTSASPWIRLGAYLVEGILVVVTLGIGWLIWAAMIGGTGQTPAKRLLNLRAISAATIEPVGMGRMFWMRYFIGGLVAGLAIPLTLGVLVFMPFWDKRNQNIWDKVSGTYVVSDPADAWGTKPDLRSA